MEDFISDAKYLIIKFDEVVNGKIIVELVPSSWVSPDGDNWCCKYPPQHHYKHLDRWIESEREPKEEWESFKDVTIVNKAYDYEQGKRRMQRAYTSLSQAESTDGERKRREELPLHYSKSLTTSMLHESTSLSVQAKSDAQTVDNGSVKLTRNTTKGKLENLYEQMDNSQKIFAQYMDLLVTSKVNSAKLSIQYDLEQKMNQLKLSINSLDTYVPGTIESERKEIISSLPIRDTCSFLTFDGELNENSKKQQALKLHFKVLTTGSKDFDKDSKTIIPAVIMKAVQSDYSGAGRMSKGIAKKKTFLRPLFTNA